MIGAIVFQILRGESQHVNVFGPRREKVEPLLQVVIVVEERAAGATGQFREHIVGLRGGASIILLQTAIAARWHGLPE